MKKDEMADFIESVGDDLEMTESGKYRFVVSSMEFPATASVETLKAHYNGRAMRRARVERANEQYDFSAHLPNIVPHKFMNENKFLFCYLTGKTLPRNASVVEKHVNGKKYKRKLKESLEKKEELDRVKEKRKERAQKAKLSRKQKKALKDGDAKMAPSAKKNSPVNVEDGDETMGAADTTGSGEEFAKAAENGFAGDSEALLQDTLAAALADSDAESGDSNGSDMEDVDCKVQEEDAEDNFWTRGKKAEQKSSKKSEGDGEDSDSDEWSSKKKRKPKGKHALTRALDTNISGGLKRKRAPPVAKKLRQARRRRNSAGAAPGSSIVTGK